MINKTSKTSQVSINTKSNHKKVNRRKFNRITLYRPILSDLIIQEESRANSVNSIVADATIHNISYGGLCFSSPFIVSNMKNVKLHFTILIFQDVLKVSGKCVWQKKISNGKYQYGVEFLMTMMRKRSYKRN